MDVEVLLQVRCPYNTDTEVPPEEGNISHNNNGLSTPVFFVPFSPE